jgi:cytoskeletal protein CcmA (bactofilin family)
MFKSNRDRDERAIMPPALPLQQAGGGKRGMFSVLGPDVIVIGNVSASADLHIDGRVEGNVDCATLAQGMESQIFGDVTAESARLAGSVEGTVRVKQLTIERSAKISGDVEYESITIDNGGHIHGHLKHMSTVAAATTSASGPRAAEPSTFSVANEQAA